MKILVLCTGNSCRSIIAEAILRSMGHEAKSAGSKPTGRVNENAKRLLKERGLWSDDLHSKPIEAVMDEEFDLVITVCDNAKESCPTFGAKTKTLHIPFEDPDGKPYEVFEELFEKMRQRLPKVIGQSVENTRSGVKVTFRAVPKETIFSMVQNCQNGRCECMSDETKAKITDMQIVEDAGSIELHIDGAIEKEEIERALERSKLLKK
jgi:arsenate reductase